MNDNHFDRVPEEFLRNLVECVRKAHSDDLSLYRSTFKLDTKTSIPHFINDQINTHVRETITSETIEVIEFFRCGHLWEGRWIIDYANRFAISIIRKNSLLRVKRTSKNLDRNRPHYLETWLQIINANLEPKYIQLEMEPYFTTDLPFGEEVYKEDMKTIYNGNPDDLKGYIHFLFEFDTNKNKLSTIKLLLLDHKFRNVDAKSLDYLIAPDFAALTQFYSVPFIEKEKSSNELLKLKDRSPDPINPIGSTDPANTPSSPVSPKSAEKKA